MTWPIQILWRVALTSCLPAHHHELPLGGLSAHALPDVHGEERAAAVEDGREGGHESSHHDGDHQTSQAWRAEEQTEQNPQPTSQTSSQTNTHKQASKCSATSWRSRRKQLPQRMPSGWTIANHNLFLTRAVTVTLALLKGLWSIRSYVRIECEV